MQDALAIVVVAVVVVAALVGVAMVLLSRGSYDQIGRSDITFDRDAAGDAGREEELRQLLAATNAQRAAHGRPPLDPATLAGAPDDELRAEIRALAHARNARRIARGLPPLDVEAEVERRLQGRDE